jgi:hypothetical protein
MEVWNLTSIFIYHHTVYYGENCTNPKKYADPAADLEDSRGLIKIAER